MTAISPYAPPRRNSTLRRRRSSISETPSSGHVGTGVGGTSTVLITAFLVAWRVWSDVDYRRRVQEFWRRSRPGIPVRPPLGRWLQSIVSAPTTAPNDQGNGSTDRHETSRDASWDECKSSSSPSSSSLSRIRDNQRLIRKVMNYWFGQHTPDESQKRLWMIAHSSDSLRRRVDQDITEKFEMLMLELVGTSEHADNPTQRWKEWCSIDDLGDDVDVGSGDGDGGDGDGDGSLYGYAGKVAAIVVLDQFSRHIQRHYETTHQDRSPLPPTCRLDAWALKTAELFVECHASEIERGMIPLPQYIFALMPFRHASTIRTVELVQQRIDDCANLSAQLEAMLGRFRKATNRRLAVLQDEARRAGKQRTTPKDMLSLSNDLANATTTPFTDDEILESFAFDADMTPAKNHSVVKTIQSFLTEQGIIPSGPPCPIIVSLSGGVDSMVIASVLAHCRDTLGYSNLQLRAVHIDYANRPESGAEADFVRRYCHRSNIDFQCRRIDEVTRGVTARDDYERIARELRYNTYKETIAAATKDLQDMAMPVGVMLGHHRGDLRENVLSNAHKGCGPLDLSGMTAVSRNDGVTIYRPLLPLEKSFVLDYAHKFGVPYFKDTTPHWSTRGKLRNQLIPLLEEIYGDGSMKNLSNLAVESDECRALLYKSMIGPFLDRIQRRPMGIVMDTAPWKKQTIFFWKFVLREALHSASLGMFSDKSVASFLERIQASKLRAGWLQCRRDYAVYLQEDGRVYVFYPSSFPFAKKDMYNVLGKAVPYAEDYRVGPWVVKAEIVCDKAIGADQSILTQKALPSMDHLMNGRIEYVVEAPTWKEGGNFSPRPLVFNRFTKASRPPAWKNSEKDRNLYLKVQETLPILGNDDVSQAALVRPQDEGNVHTGQDTGVDRARLVHVTIQLDK